MPLTTAEKSQITSSVETLAGLIGALVPDPVPNPLQVQLDAALDANAALTSQLSAANAEITALNLRISNAQTALAG